MSTLKYYDENEFKSVGSRITGDTLPIGSIIPFAGANAPAGWLICDGRTLLKSQYQSLYKAIGTQYGGDDEHFNLPDMRGNVPVGLKSGDTEFGELGNEVGEKKHTLTVNEMPSHTHHLMRGGQSFVATNGAWAGVLGDWGEYDTGSTGGNQPHNIIQPSIVINYIIKAFQTAGEVGTVSNTKVDSEISSYSTKYVNELVVNERSESTDNTYSCDYINKNDTYSTSEEIKTGNTWIDGKPLYRMTINCGNFVSYGTKEVPINIPNIDFIMIDRTHSYFLDENYNTFEITDYDWHTNVADGKIQMTTTGNRGYAKIFVTLEYTKTTD